MRVQPLAWVLLGILSCASADTVVLKDGRTLEGRVLERHDDTLALQVTFGTLYIPLTEIEEVIVEPSLLDIFEEKRNACVTVEDFEALVAWCEAEGYPPADALRALRSARIAAIRHAHPNDWCLHCGGAQDVPCATCEGDGDEEHSCAACEAQGEVACPTCLETPGTSRCVTCEATGTVAKECRPCRATGRARCERCKGDRRRRCSTCRGSGSVTELRDTYVYLNGQLVPAKREVYVDCNTCDRRGSVPCRSCDADGKATCGVCSGAGTVPDRCRDCRGKPIRRCRTCRGDAVADCEACRGRGEVSEDCTTCAAGGRLVCPTCDGRGWGRE